MFVIPKDGRSVPDPARGDLLPASGRNVDDSNYWYRRVTDGDVEEGKMPLPETAPEITPAETDTEVQPKKAASK